MKLQITLQRVLVFIFLSITFSNCASSRFDAKPLGVTQTSVYDNEACFNFSSLSGEDRIMADSLLDLAMNHEALHTIMSTIKPMSDVKGFRWQIETADTLSDSTIIRENIATEYIGKFEQLERISEVFSCGVLASAPFPFENLYEGERYIQFRVFRTDAIDIMLEKHPEFWSQWGFVEGSNPEIVISVMEYESRLNRYRGYGYLYGYPDHAVDFFVDAANHEDKTGEFVERDFIHLPVASSDSGRFVYAVEKNHVLLPADNYLRKEAQNNMDVYFRKKSIYRDTEGNINNADLLRDLYTEQGWHESN